MRVSCSILSNELKASDIVKKIENTKVDYIHLDIMDGKFVENKTWTYSEIKKIVSNTTKKLDVHLMVKDPQKYLDDYAMLNTEYLTFHYETVKDVNEMINEVKRYGLKVGMSINPDTNVNEIIPYLKDLDLILVMSVYPGKSGQEFIEDSLSKISLLKEIIKENEYKTVIEVDGGINEETSLKAALCGADILVSASFLHKDINNINMLKNIEVKDENIN